MAKYGVLKNAFIQVGNTDLSDHCIELRPVYGNAGVQGHAFGDDQEYQNPGLRTRALTARFLNDFAADSVFATLNPLKNGGKHVVQYKNENSTTSALNPNYSGLWFISSIDGLVAGTMGGNSETVVTWTSAAAEQEATS